MPAENRRVGQRHHRGLYAVGKLDFRGSAPHPCKRHALQYAIQAQREDKFAQPGRTECQQQQGCAAETFEGARQAVDEDGVLRRVIEEFRAFPPRLEACKHSFFATGEEVLERPGVYFQPIAPLSTQVVDFTHIELPDPCFTLRADGDQFVQAGQHDGQVDCIRLLAIPDDVTLESGKVLPYEFIKASNLPGIESV